MDRRTDTWNHWSSTPLGLLSKKETLLCKRGANQNVTGPDTWPGITSEGWAGAVKLQNRDKKKCMTNEHTDIHTYGRTHPFIELLARN